MVRYVSRDVIMIRRIQEVDVGGAVTAKERWPLHKDNLERMEKDGRRSWIISSVERRHRISCTYITTSSCGAHGSRYKKMTSKTSSKRRKRRHGQFGGHGMRRQKSSRSQAQKEGGGSGESGAHHKVRKRQRSEANTRKSQTKWRGCSKMYTSNEENGTQEKSKESQG